MNNKCFSKKFSRNLYPKWAHRIEESEIRNLERCIETLKDKLRLSVILYGITEIVPLSSRMIALPFPVFFGIEI